MKKITLLLVLMVFATSCVTKKKVERALTSGNYNEAISNAIDKLESNKDAKRNQDYILLLKDAYDKANTRDTDAIASLKASNNPELYKRIYETYTVLVKRQNAIKPLLPLRVNGKEVFFKSKDYNNDLSIARENVSDHFYEKGIDLLEGDDKFQIEKPTTL